VTEVRMTIPDIRMEMLKLATIVATYMPAQADRLRELAEATRRRKSPFRRAPNRLRAPSDEDVAAVRALKQAHPAMSLQEIATRVGTNIGRVSEILSGKRDGS
jgi:hypothetical protein